MTIPLVDLKAQYINIQSEVDDAIRTVIDRSAFIKGDEVSRFEAEFAEYCQARACVGVGNGTDALYLALRALGIGVGDEVITVAHTFIATAEAISAVGASPVFVDILDDTMLMDPRAFEEAITPQCRAVIPVHLYGQPCEMDRIVEIARRHGLKVIEDAAQAHGARWNGRRVGTFGDASCFSFFPGKNLGAYGDGGAVVSQDANLIDRVRILANHGRREKYTHEMVGVNSRLDGLQAAILRVKLRHLDSWNEMRRMHAAYYLRSLAQCAVRTPTVQRLAEPVWHLFVIRAPDREELKVNLKRQAIEAGVHYPIPLHLQPAYYKTVTVRRPLATTERAAQQVLSLPLYPEITSAQLDCVIECLRTSFPSK